MYVHAINKDTSKLETQTKTTLSLSPKSPRNILSTEYFHMRISIGWISVHIEHLFLCGMWNMHKQYIDEFEQCGGGVGCSPIQLKNHQVEYPCTLKTFSYLVCEISIRNISASSNNTGEGVVVLATAPMAVWYKELPLTTSCLSPLHGFEFRPVHARKLSVTWV